MKKLALYKCFNPRTHTGCDNPERVAVNNVRRVSIHAPTRGATVTITDYPTTNGELQSPHPPGVRHPVCSYKSITLGFNPRTHTGCDIVIAILICYEHHVSIHAPTRGATKRNSR